MDKDDLKRAIIEAHYEIERNKIEGKRELMEACTLMLDELTTHERKLVEIIAEAEGCSEVEAFIFFAGLTEQGWDEEYLTDLERPRNKKVVSKAAS